MTHNLVLEEQLERVRLAYHDPRLLDYLAARYAPYRLLQRGGERYPVVFFPAGPAQRARPESVLGPLSPAMPPDNSYVVDDPAYRDAIATLNLFSLPATVDRLTITMERMRHDAGGIEIAARNGKFMASARTCEILDWEIRSAIAGLATAAGAEAIGEKVPLRNALHATVADPVLDGSGRSAALAITCLIVYRRAGAYYALMRKRGKRGSPLYAYMYQAVPSFMLQATDARWLRHEYSLVHQISREYLEEVYSYPEPANVVDDPDYFYHEPQFQRLHEMLARGTAQLYVTGIGMNLLNLRADICALLVIHDERWFIESQTNPTCQFRFNDEWETAIARPGTDAYVGAIPIDPSASDEEVLRVSHLSQRETTPAGAAAWWGGLDCFRSIRG